MTDAPPKVQVRPLDMCMSDTMPFAQRWTCRTTWPLADVLTEQFFLPMRQTLRAGDTVEIMRFDRNDSNDKDARLLEMGKVVIVKSGPAALAVEIAVVGQVIILGEGMPRGVYEVRRGQSGKYKLMQGEDVVAEFGSKGECEAALAKKLAA